MAITYSIDNARGVVLTTATGVLTDDELLDHKKKVVSDPAFRPGMVELTDARSIERLDVTPNGVARLAFQDRVDAPKLAEFKLAIVVSKDLTYGMGRMYQMQTMSNPLSVNIFRDMHAACEWLGIAANS